MGKQASKDPQEPQASKKGDLGLSEEVLAAAKDGDWKGVQVAQGVKARPFIADPGGKKNRFGVIGIKLDVPCEKCGFAALRNDPGHATCVVCGEVYWS